MSFSGQGGSLAAVMMAGGKSLGSPEPRVCGLGLASGVGMGALIAAFIGAIALVAGHAMLRRQAYD